MRVKCMLAPLSAAVLLWRGVATAAPLAAWMMPLTANEIAAKRARAEAGDPFAAEQMGELYYHWAGMKPDYIEAARWFHKAAALDKNWANASNDSLKEMEAFTVEHARLFAATQSGDAKALFDFALNEPHNASGLTGDSVAEHWLLMSAQKGYLPAQVALGKAYFAAYYRRRWQTTESAVAVAFGQIGLDYPDPMLTRTENIDLDFEGESLDQDLPTAISWFEKSARAGEVSSEYWLALAYAAKGEVAADDKARTWLLKAAVDNPDSEAMHDVCELAVTGTVTHIPLVSAAQPLVRFQQAPDYKAGFRCFARVQRKYSNGWDGEAPFYLGYTSRQNR